MKNITLQRLEEIEKERIQVQGNPDFHNWMKSLNVSRLWSNPEPIFNASQMNKQYDNTKLKQRHAIGFHLLIQLLPWVN